MEIRMIRTFQMIVKLGSFQKAAEALQYSQPTVTMHIKKLEEELEVELLIRAKIIKMTEAGRIFYERADRMLKEYEYLCDSIADFRQGEAGLVRIGGSEPWVSQFMPSLLPLFVEKYPKVQISIMSGSSNKLSEMLANDLIDFAVCTEPEANLQIHFEPLLKEPMALLIPESHRLSGRKEISVKELKNEKFLMTMGNCPIRIKVESIISNNIDDLKHQSIEVANISSLKYYVQANLGIALAPIVAIYPEIPATLLKPVIDLHEGFQIGILKRRYDPPQGTAVLRLMQEVEQFLTTRHTTTQSSKAYKMA
jgi:DNA-binding transcriptional LysR family regulator